MAEIVVWHNPRCGKSRRTLELLRARGVEPVVREYMREPPARAEIAVLLDALGGPPAALVRDCEPEFAASGRDAADLTRDDAVDLIVRHPKLLQRPIVVADRRAAIGRPPEAALALLDGHGATPAPRGAEKPERRR